MVRKRAKISEELAEARYYARLRWKHSSFMGQVRLSRMNLGGIIDSTTTTAETKALASSIAVQLERLGASLNYRIEPDGTTVPHRKEK